MNRLPKKKLGILQITKGMLVIILFYWVFISATPSIYNTAQYLSYVLFSMGLLQLLEAYLGIRTSIFYPPLMVSAANIAMGVLLAYPSRLGVNLIPPIIGVTFIANSLAAATSINMGSKLLIFEKIVATLIASLLLIVGFTTLKFNDFYQSNCMSILKTGLLLWGIVLIYLGASMQRLAQNQN
jgi:hypothetical protein